MAGFNFYRPSKYNKETKSQLWMSAINDSHDAFCGCCKPFAHLLCDLFPEGHKDLDLTIRQIIDREIKNPPWCFGGKEDESGGGEAKEENITGETSGLNQKDTEEEEEKDIEKLIAAFEDAERR